MRSSARFQRLALAALALLAAPAAAQGYNIDLASNGIAPPSTFGAAGSPGVWNALAPVLFGPALPLVDTTGQSNGVTLLNQSFSAGFANFTSGSMGGDHAVLLRDGYTVTDIPGTMRVQGLPSGTTYQAYIYGIVPGSPSTLTSFIQPPGTGVVGGAWTDAYVEGVTHARVRRDIFGNGEFRVDWVAAVFGSFGFFSGVQLENVWQSQGGSVAGVTGQPELFGQGTLAGGDPVTLTTELAAPNAPAWLVVGFSQLDLPWFSGALVPSPDVILGPYTTDPHGNLNINFTLGPGLPADALTVWQVWVLDGAAPGGLAATNGLAATTF